MARKLVKQHDVFDHADDLSSEGITPTTRLIYERLGVGSLSTITKYLREWERQNCAIEQESASPVPKLIAETNERLLAQMWLQAQEAASSKYEKQVMNLDAQKVQARTEVSFALQIADEAVIERDNAVNALRVRENELAKISSAYNELMMTFDAIQEQRNNLRDQLADTTERFNQHKTESEKLQKYADQQSWELDRRKEEITALIEKNEACTLAREQAKYESTRNESRATELSLQVQNLKTDLQTQQEAAHAKELAQQESLKQQGLLQDRLANIVSERDELRREQKEASQNIARLGATVDTKQERIDELLQELSSCKSALRDVERKSSELNGQVISQHEQLKGLNRELSRCQRQLGKFDNDV